MNLFHKSIFTLSIAFFFLFITPLSSCQGQGHNENIFVGAEQLGEYLPLLEGKRVALIVNQTSLVGKTHIVDTLISSGVKIKKVFAPEHGFRGEADAGEHVQSAVDTKTALPIVSLYGQNKKPTADQLADIDVVVFDIQDVGARFYTYISTMHYAMEACAENNKAFIVLDRPNPNGHYVDGPILEPKYKSFVGMHPIPVVHGLTVGELALMINGENWLESGLTCDLKVITVKNYTHSDSYILPVRPSPNLPNQQSIALYPSICFFEGTPVSLGRGTDFPFQAIGYPNPKFGDFTFTPVSTPGAKNPPLQNQLCYGKDLRKVEVAPGINLQYLIEFYQKAEDKEKFFTNFFNLLAGTDRLQKQIKTGMSAAEIKQTWQEPLATYRVMRDKYLLYP